MASLVKVKVEPDSDSESSASVVDVKLQDVKKKKARHDSVNSTERGVDFFFIF